MAKQRRDSQGRFASKGGGGGSKSKFSGKGSTAKLDAVRYTYTSARKAGATLGTQSSGGRMGSLQIMEGMIKAPSRGTTGLQQRGFAKGLRLRGYAAQAVIRNKQRQLPSRVGGVVKV